MDICISTAAVRFQQKERKVTFRVRLLGSRCVVDAAADRYILVDLFWKA